MKEYTQAELEIILFTAEDVITESVPEGEQIDPFA